MTALTLSATPTSWAQTSPTPDSITEDTSVMLILGASGSMWGKIGKGEAAQTKIEIARDAIVAWLANQKNRVVMLDKANRDNNP